MNDQNSDCGSDSLDSHIEVFANACVGIFLRDSSSVSKQCLETISVTSNPDHAALRQGPHVYVAYSGQCPLYAGQTGVTVRTRFKGDGDGAHDRKSWYEEVSHVRFLPLSCDFEYYRKLVEAALIIELEPREQTPNR